MISLIIRIILTIALLALMWNDNKIALYIIITLLTMSNEIIGFLIKNIMKKLNK